jgi:glyoxylase-like metal-dependent hydrolase (beta-lactamase superfamily II)
MKTRTTKTGNILQKLFSKAKWIRWVGALAFAILAWSASDSLNLVRGLAPGVFVRMGNRDRNQPANSGWVVFHDYVLVIDANFPWGAREILPEIRRTTKNKPIRFVFNTHCGVH